MTLEAKLPVVDETKLPVVDETKLPVVDETKSPVVDETKLPVVDDTKLPVTVVKKKIIVSKKIVDITLNSPPPPINFVYDTWIPWSEKSATIPFGVTGKKNDKGVGNGERKLACELGIMDTIGGQNSKHDLIHPVLGTISVKDMTKDSCRLGVNGSHKLRTIFRKAISPLVSWSEKYKETCTEVAKIWAKLQQSYGKGTTILVDGIDRLELSHANLLVVNSILADVLKLKYDSVQKQLYSQKALNSEYLDDILSFFSEKESLIDKLNDCVRKEALEHTLIVVSDKKGWLIAKNLDKISCHRITSASPRIGYKD
jgi:hypothetical protein